MARGEVTGAGGEAGGAHVSATLTGSIRFGPRRHGCDDLFGGQGSGDAALLRAGRRRHDLVAVRATIDGIGHLGFPRLTEFSVRK